MITIPLGNRNTLPVISTVVGPQMETSQDGSAMSSLKQFGIQGHSPPLAGAALQRMAIGRFSYIFRQ